MKLIHISSAHYNAKTAYGISKKNAEHKIQKLVENCPISTTIFRLPGVFGKWARPNYNSVVATFCHNVANNLPIEINAPDKEIQLVYVDDVMGAFKAAITDLKPNIQFGKVFPEYNIRIEDLAEKIYSFNNIQNNLTVPKVGSGLDRALYSTFLSYLPPERFKHAIPAHKDDRGLFVEMLKTEDAGQISFFTARSGVTRGCHYHHTKNEKFLVISGRAEFKFRNLQTNEIVVFETSENLMEIVITPPGWVHSITNVGQKELKVMLWANEIFNPQNQDTIHCEI